jgi:protein-S-isoprenylcysteine O-methyltransferase Ste14
MTPESTFQTLFWVLFGGVLLMRFFFIFRVRRAGQAIMPDTKAVKREGKGLFAFRLASWFLMIGILASYALNLPWLTSLHTGFADWLRWAGFALGLVSIAFWTWTQLALGKQWSPQLRLREEHHLITTGPYARMRHPMYAGVSGFGLGLALVSANWVFVALAALVILGMAFRVPQEEHMMIDEFGETYRVYMQRTGRFLPR